MPTPRQARREQIALASRALKAALELSEIPDALHKEPALRELFCRAGRHDFEVFSTSGKRSAELECFYCGARRGSQRPLA